MKIFVGIKKINSSFTKTLILIFLFVALFGPIISNNKPLVIIKKGEISFPAFYELIFLSINTNEKSYEGDFVLYPIFYYSPKQIDLNNSNYVSPFARQKEVTILRRHWLGTDLLGRDVLAGLIYGCRTAFLVGFFSMVVSFLIGVLLGSISGYWADDKIKITWLEILILILFLIYCSSFLFSGIVFQINYAMNKGFIEVIKLVAEKFLFLILSVALLFGLFKLMRKWFRRFIVPSYYLPVDFIITRIIEVFEAVPIMFLIIALMAVLKPSMLYVILIIGLTSWPPLAKYTRAEFLKIRKLDYVEAAKSLGFSDWRIMFFHILPNAINPVLVALTFGVANAILAESTLSFLGLGLAADEVTWGSMIAGARQAPEAWWLVLFPGMMIFFMVWTLNNLANDLMKNMDKRLLNDLY